MCYPALAQFSDDLQPQPDLALSWETSPDGLTWTFNLRDDAVWSDGKPITASDAAYTINTAVKFQAGAAANVSPFVVGIKDATASDATTLVVTLNSPQPALPANLMNLAILPEHVWGPLAVDDGAQLQTPTNDPATETVVVSGPFTVEKNDPQGTTIFTRVETYYGEKPLIPGYGLQLFTSPDAAAQALKAGDVDVSFPIPSSLAESLRADPNLEVQGTSKLPLVFGLNNSPNYTIHPELTDMRLREAIDIAIDREQIVSDVYQGYAVPGGSLIYPEYTPAYMSAPLSPVTRDVARANQILDEAGCTKGPDGIRMANGQPMEYTVVLWSARSGDHRRLFGVLKQNLAEVGISLVSEMTDDAWGAFIGYTPGEFYSTKDAWLLSYVGNPDPDSGLVMFSSGTSRGWRGGTESLVLRRTILVSSGTDMEATAHPSAPACTPANAPSRGVSKTCMPSTIGRRPHNNAPARRPGSREIAACGRYTYASSRSGQARSRYIAFSMKGSDPPEKSCNLYSHRACLRRPSAQHSVGPSLLPRWDGLDWKGRRHGRLMMV